MEINERNIKLWSSLGPRATLGLVVNELAKVHDDLVVLTCDVSTSAGLMVTKAGIKGSPEKALFNQLSGHPKALGVSSFLLVVMAMLPGIPAGPFLFLGVGAGLAAFFVNRSKEKTKTEKNDASAAANDYLKTLGFVSVAYAWIKVLEVSFKDYDENKDFYDDKINTAKFYFDKVLPRAEQHYKTAISGSSNIMNFKFN